MSGWSGAVEACRGVPTMVVSRDRLCHDPLGTGRALQTWAFPTGEEKLQAAAPKVHPKMRYCDGPIRSDVGPSAKPLALYAALEALHAHFPTSKVP